MNNGMLQRYVLESVGIVLFSVCLALASNQIRRDGLPWVRPKHPSSGTTVAIAPQEGVVSLQELEAALKRTGVVLVDARSSEEFAAGHLPDARNLPYFAGPEAFTVFLQEVPFDLEVITYCEGLECSGAETLALQLRQLGYNKVRIFAGGWEEWTKHNRPVVRGGN